MSTEFELIEHSHVKNVYTFLIEMHHRRSHLHTDIEIVYVLRGSLKITTNNRDILVKSDEIVVINSCQLHEFHSEDSALLLVFQFSPTNFETFFPQIYELYFSTIPLKLFDSSNGKRLLKNLLEASKSYFQEDDHYSLICHGYSSLILFDLLKIVPYQLIDEKKHDYFLQKLERIKRISDYITTHLQEKLLLADIAKNEDLSVTYLSHFFHKNFGVSFQVYLNILRCEQAQHLLSNTENTLLRICELCGFSDIRYLNRSFKHIYGVSPKEFREKNKNLLENKRTQIKENRVDQQFIFSKEQSLLQLKQLEIE